MNTMLKKPVMKFFKAHPDAKLPQKNHMDDAGWDLYSVEDKIIPANGKSIVDVGLKLAYLEPGYWIRVASRSGMSFKHGILAHPGVVDNGYRGDLGVLLYNHDNVDHEVKKGDRVAQIVIHFNVDLDIEWDSNCHETERGSKGFGSSGR